MSSNGRGDPATPEDKFDLITVWRGRDSATYLAGDFEKLGDKAKPLWVSQWPGANVPFHKIELKDVDRIWAHRGITKEDFDNWESSWDIVALRKLLSAGAGTATTHNNQSTEREYGS